jgi:aryl-alcohol dehydrogenase-like predicted oxidoreductase
MTMSWAAAGLTDHNFAIVESLRGVAGTNGRTLLELAISWLLRQPSVVSVIAGATSAEQIRANAAAANWEIPKDDLAAIDRIAV